MPASIVFPVTLPPPLRGLEDTYEDSRRAFTPEVGVARRRQRFRTTPRLFDVTFHFTQAQYSAFDTWWQETLQGGSREFDIRLPDDSDTLTWFTVTWVDAYQATVTEVMDWRVTGQLRAKEGTFGATRPSGTNDLRAVAQFGFPDATCALRVTRSIRGVSTFGFETAQARLNLFPLRGASEFLFAASTARLVASHPQLSRQWSRSAWFGTAASQDVNTNASAINREWME